MSRYIQVGVTALRDPFTGEPLEAVPMYIREKDVEKACPPPAGMMKELSGTLGKMFGQYVDGTKKLKDKEGRKNNGV